MKRSIFILFILCVAIIPLSTYGQVSVDSTDIVVNMYPENPTPNQSVTVEIESYITNLDAAQITWSLNGSIAESGAGKKSLTFKTGNEGTTTNLTIIVITDAGKTVTKTLRLNPVYVDLMWESESYTPPFYRGKALFSSQNRITFIALPHLLGSNGQEISPNNLMYTWKKDGTVMNNESGYGKNTFLFIPTVIARPVEIRVEVTRPNSSVKGTAIVFATPTEPFIRFYEKNPLYGIQFQKSLMGTVEMKNSREISITSVPYFYGTKNPYEGLSYKWSLNGKLIDNDVLQTTRVFRQVDGASGTSNIGLTVESANKILQFTKASLNINFSAPTASESGFN